MKIIFLGATKFSEEILRHLLSRHFNIGAIFTIPEKFHISYSTKEVRNCNFSDLRVLAREHRIPLYTVDSIPGKKLLDYMPTIEEIEPDVMIAAGWYFMIPKGIRDFPEHGVWGIHASLLPQYAGGAPLVWAIINGEKRTGVTLFKISDGVDDGDIIAQKSFAIKFGDTVKDVYQKATEVSKYILIKSLKNIRKMKPRSQDKSKIKIYPQRKPEDGEIDFRKSARELYNFIRAQSEPYPGAFFKTVDGKKIIIEKARIENL